MAKRAPTEFHYVAWDFRRWLASETRSRANAIGGLLGQAVKGVYRDLLDTCYDAGTIPADMIGLAASAGCTVTEMEQIWPHIEGKFKRHARLQNRLTNTEVEMRRREFVRTLKQKSRAGAKSAQKRGFITTSESKDLGNTRSTQDQQVFNEKKRTEQNRTEKNRTTTTEFGGGALALDERRSIKPIEEAVARLTIRPDGFLCSQILQRAMIEDSELTPEALAMIIPLSIREGYPVDSGALFLTTVPKYLRSDDWSYLRTFFQRGRAAMSEAQGVLRDRKAPEPVMRFLRAWLASVQSEGAAA